MNPGTRISSEEDFPHLAIYERHENGQPVMTIVFQNPEFSSVRGIFWWLVMIALIIAVLPVLIFAFQMETWLGTILVAGGYIFLTAYVLTQTRIPKPVKRMVEMDFGRNQITIYKGDRPEMRQPLDFKDLTVEDHPDAESAKQNRIERGDKGVSNKEKQHVLIGWFGAGGSQQVTLLQRGEWPSRHSLRQVRIAMLWARDRAALAVQPHKTEDMHPPLD